MNIKIDMDRCVGAGQCMASAPAIFSQDEQGLVLLLREEVSEADREALMMAIGSCPTLAISLTED